MKTLYVFAIAIFTLSFHYLKAQSGGGTNESTEAEFARMSHINQQMVIPPSPEAASLGKYGDFQLNQYTGAASLSVPIYTIQGKGVQVPISLQYDASGNKVATRPGWVGLGWTLSAGGVITRSVIGNPDLLCNYYSKSAELSQTTSYLNGFTENDFLYDLASGEIEGQPDQYYYSFPGGSGKFYIKPNETVVHKEWKSVDIDPSFHTTGGNADYDIEDFVVKDQNGNRYYFEAVEETSLCLDDGADAQSEFFRSICGTFCWDFNTTWHLTRIQNSYETIIFEYEEDLTDYEVPIHPYENKTESISFGGGPTDATGQVCCGNAGASGQFWSSVDHSTINNRHFLKKITYQRAGVDLEVVEFSSSSNTCAYADPTARKLDKITITRGKVGAAQPMVREFALDYQTNCTQKRLLLTQVQEQLDSNTPVKPPFVFEYDNTVFPSFISTSVDHWGYYNAKSNGTSMIPVITFGSVSYNGSTGANRAPSTVMRAGVLEKVTYPTKGYTEFDLGPHWVAGKGSTYNYDPTASPTLDRMVGGLRVNAISHYDHDGTRLLRRTYQYIKQGHNPGSPTSSSGIVLSEPSYDLPASFFHDGEPDFNGIITCLNLTYTCQKATITASNKSQLGSVQGSHVGYSRVEEIIASNDINSSATSGKTVSTYHNDYNISIHDNIENGMLLKTEAFDDADKRLSSKELFYSLENSANHTPEIRNSDFFYGVRAEAKSQQSNQIILCHDPNFFSGSGYGFITQFDSENPSISGVNCIDQKIYRTQFKRDHYALRQKWLYAYKQIETSYHYNTSGTLAGQVETTTLFTYDNQNITLPTRTEVTNSDGSVHMSKSLFVTDFLSPDYGLNTDPTNQSALTNLQLNRSFASPILQARYVDGQLIYQNKISYKNFGSKALPHKIYEETPGSGNILKEVLDGYDLSGNLTQAYRHYDDGPVNPPVPYDPASLHEPISRIFDANGRLMLAQVQNAETEEIAFSSFEKSNASSDGNWTIIPAGSMWVSGGKTGEQAFQMPTSSASIQKTIGRAGEYVVALWYKGSPRITTGSSYQNLTNANDWTYWEGTFSLNNGDLVKVHSSVGAPVIDELRLFPSDAQMSTFCYNDHLQIQCATDVNGKSNYYHYDTFNRLQYVLDQDGNYVQELQYHYIVNP